MRSILITGGSGIVGQLIIPFLNKKYNVVNYDQINGDDIFDKKNLTSKMKNRFVVIHLAAIPHPLEGPKELYKKLNYEGAIQVFETAKENGIKKFIFLSSGCVYGMWGGKTKVDKFPIDEENYKPTLEEGQTYYGYYKLKFEEYLKNNSNNNTKSISFRLELPGSTNLYPDHFFITISVKNLCHIIDLALEKNLENNFEAFNLSNPKIQKFINVQKWIKKTWPNVPNYTTDNETLYDISKAKRLLGYDPENPYRFKYYFDYYKNKLKIFGANHILLTIFIIFSLGIITGIIIFEIFNFLLK